MAKLYPLQMQLDRREIASRTVTFVASTTDAVRCIEHEQVGEKWVEREYWDAIVEWDFERILKNPLVAYSHDTYSLPIGTIEALEFQSTTGLLATIKFATERANPHAEQIWRAMEEGIIRSVSVGFDREILSTEQRDGKTYRKTKGYLSEISVVPLPADDDALARSVKRANSMAPDGSNYLEIDEEADRRKKVSEAAKLLGTARKPKEKLDLDDTSELHFDAASRLDSKKIERTSVGGIKVPARIARTGVLTYRRGTQERREYRPPEEVFRPESLASFEGAPVIDFTDHVALVTTEDFRKKTIGHTANVRMDGDYVLADLYINDASAIEMIDRGERLDISAGYVARKHDFTPGSFNGEEYDLIQRDIVGNHVALCPPNRGRSGPEVSLRLDSNAAHWSAIQTKEDNMSQATIIKLDGKDFEYGSEAHIAKIEQLHSAEIAKVKAESDELRAKFDAAEAEKKKAKDGEEEAAKKAKEEEEEKAKKAKARMKRALRAARIMEEDDEEKLDAIFDKSDREIMIAAIQHVEPKFDRTDETDDYLRARFDALEVPAGKSDSVGSVVKEIEKARLDAADDDPAEKARKEMIERNRNAWKKQA